MQTPLSYHLSAMPTGKLDFPDINELVSANLKRVLGKRTPEAYCGEKPKLLYVSGSKRGKAVAPRALRYAIDGEQAPRLDLIAAVAAREGLHPYQLLFFDFDPRNAPVIISKEQAELIARIQASPKAVPR